MEGWRRMGDLWQIGTLIFPPVQNPYFLLSETFISCCPVSEKTVPFLPHLSHNWFSSWDFNSRISHKFFLPFSVRGWWGIFDLMDHSGSCLLRDFLSHASKSVRIAQQFKAGRSCHDDFPLCCPVTEKIVPFLSYSIWSTIYFNSIISTQSLSICFCLELHKCEGRGNEDRIWPADGSYRAMLGPQSLNGLNGPAW